jgi:hypothetical protein
MTKKVIKKLFAMGGVEINRSSESFSRFKSLHRKYENYSMVPEDFFIFNLDLCNQYKHLNGDYVECGVWRGGMSAAVSEILGPEKTVHLFDSFQGLPPAKDIDGKSALQWQKDTESPGYFDNCTAEESAVHEAMRLANHTMYNVYKGWFEDTLKTFPGIPVSILRLDGDWYDSILICLKYLFPKVIEGGIIILDDYYTWDGCTKAVHDYLSETKSPSRIYQWKNRVAFIIKSNG